MGTVKPVTMPDLGEGLTESDLVEWTVAVGDTVELNQVVAEVETAKALVQLPSPYAGVVTELVVEAGTTVRVGSPIMTITVSESIAAGRPSAEGASPSDVRPSGGTPPSEREPSTQGTPPSGHQPSAEDAVPSRHTPPDGLAPADEHATARPTAREGVAVPTAARTTVLVGYGPLVERSDRPRRRSRSAGWTASHATPVGDGPHVSTNVRRVNPPVRKLAHDLGVDLNRVEGTGQDGMITREDVLQVVSGATAARTAARTRVTPSVDPRAAAGLVGRETPTRPAGVLPSAAPATRDAARDGRAPATSGAPRDVRVPVTGVRKQTAAAMVASAFTAPHASAALTVDVTESVDLVDGFRADRALVGHRVTVLTLVAKAMTIALHRNPTLNSRWDEDTGEIVQHGSVHLGIAAATPRGLLVPVVRDADRLTLPELADAVSALTESARAGTCTPGDLTGGTVTLTNIGVFGVDTGTPILVPGQAAIVAMGAVRRRPWEFRDEVALRHVMTLSVSFDHRVVDGEQASRFLSDLGAILTHPGAVLRMI